MGIAELIVAICLQAEPSACRIFHRRQPGATGCAVIEEAEDLLATAGWYRARWTCRWRG